MPAYSLYDPALYQQRCAPHTVVYYDKVWQDFHMPTHSHPQVEIMMVISGMCHVFYAENGGEKGLRLTAGQYILLDTDVPHRLQVDAGQPCAMKNIEFTFAPCDGAQVSMGQLRAASEDFQALLRKKSPVLTGRDAQGDLLRAFDTLLTFYLYSLEKPHAKAVADHAFSMLLLAVAYLQTQSGAGGGVHFLRKALQYIQEHLQEKLPIAQIAAAVNLHPVYLQRLFRQNMDCTIVEYVTGQRVERAAYLLRHTDRAVGQIAAECGFGSRQQFYRAFLSKKQRTPTQYRAAHALKK